MAASLWPWLRASRARAVWEYEGSELTHNRDDGPTCLACCPLWEE